MIAPRISSIEDKEVPMGTAKTTRHSRVKLIKNATDDLRDRTPCHVWFGDGGENAGFHVSIPRYLTEAEDQKVWDAFDERCGDGRLDDEAYEAEHNKVERELDREREVTRTSSRKMWKYVSRSLVSTKHWLCRSAVNTPIPQKKFCGIVVLQMFLAGHRLVTFKSILADCMKQ
jgi:hypothetical protein